jgi:hypothetical protein
VAQRVPPLGIGHPGFTTGKGADVHGAVPFSLMHVPTLTATALHFGMMQSRRRCFAPVL